jgi:hypothetical protein
VMEVGDGPDGSVGNAEAKAERAMCLTAGVEGAHFLYLGVGEAMEGVRLPAEEAPLADGVGIVVLARPKENVLGVDARGVVAVMARAEVVGNFATGKQVSYAVGVGDAPPPLEADAHAAVAGLVHGAQP